MLTRSTLSSGSLIICLAISAVSGGCGTFQKNAPTPMAEDAVAAANGELFVELRDSDGESFHLKAPFKESMLVQDALKKSGATRRYRRMDITLIRSLPSGQKLRMPVQYETKTKSVTPATNYSLHPNDSLEIAQDSSSTLDHMLESVLEPLRPVMR